MEHYYQTLGEDWFDFQGLYKRMVQKYDKAHFVEVGSWKGRSAVFLAVEIVNSGKKIVVDCVDTWEGSVEHSALPEVINKTLYETFLKNIQCVRHIIHPVRLDSVQASGLYADANLDFVFLDASHEYVDIKSDILCWLPKVKVGGTFAGHDIYFPGVDSALKELLLGKYTVEGNSFAYELT
jgi:predicted O-methyltransferase YrrM